MGRNGRGHFPWLIRIVRAVYARPKMKKRGVEVSGMEKLDGLDGGFLVLSNHVQTLDPILISAAMPFHVRWVAGAYLFRFKGLGFVLSKLATAIPKQQGKQEYAVLKTMRSALQANDVVGIFPEGTRTWDGDTLDLDYRTLAKMIRLFKAPVCIINLEGGYAQKPRWADEERSCPMRIHIKDLIMPSDYAEAGAGELERRLRDGLAFSSDIWQEENGIEVQSDCKAEYLERLLYLCPQCNAVASIMTDGNLVHCMKCGSRSSIDGKYRLVGDFRFSRIADWAGWQRGAIGDIDCLPPEPGVQFRTLLHGRRMKTLSKKITVSADPDSMVVVDETGKRTYFFPWENVSSLIINAKQTMELIYNGQVWRVRLEKCASSLKYMEYYKAIRARVDSGTAG